MEIFDGKKKKIEMSKVILYLNMRLRPLDMEKIFENTINDELHKDDSGVIVGWGMEMSESEMPISSELELYIHSDKLDNFISFLKNCNMIALGSYVGYNGKVEKVGTLDGLCLTLNKTALSKGARKGKYITGVISDIDALLKENGRYYSYYAGDEGTDLYFYGPSFDEMKKIIVDYVKSSLVFENSVIMKI